MDQLDDVGRRARRDGRLPAARRPVAVARADPVGRPRGRAHRGRRGEPGQPGSGGVLAAPDRGVLVAGAGRPPPEVAVGTSLAEDAAEVRALVGLTRPITGTEAGLTSAAWEDVTEHRHQVLVCRGPRCTALGLRPHRRGADHRADAAGPGRRRRADHAHRVPVPVQPGAGGQRAARRRLVRRRSTPTRPRGSPGSTSWRDAGRDSPAPAHAP